MSNKGYAVLLVLAGMVCGILLVSLSSSPAAAKLPTEERGTTRAVPTIAPHGSVSPFAAAPNIHVYPVGLGVNNIAFAYVVKDGKLWYCEGEKARAVGLQ